MDTNTLQSAEKKINTIKSAVKKATEHRPTPFMEMKFTMAQICEHLGVAKTSVYNLEKEGHIKSENEAYGHGERRVYSWGEFAKIARRFRNRIPKPLVNKVKVFANLKGGVGKSTIALVPFQHGVIHLTFPPTTLLIARSKAAPCKWDPHQLIQTCSC